MGPGLRQAVPAVRSAAAGVLIAVAAMALLPGRILAAPADGRLYEMVSPPAKNGGDVMPNTERTWAADNGGAVVFTSLTAFGDAVGTGIATDYLATRSSSPNPGTNGWDTHAISPRQDALPVTLRNAGFDPMSVLFSPDLAHSVVQSWQPLTADPSVAQVANLYARSGDAFSLVTACPLCAGTGTPLAPFALTRFSSLPRVAGMSDDGRHVLFESTLRLTRDATEGLASGAVNVYQWDDGTVRLADILPDGTAAPGAVAGQGTGAGDTPLFETPHVLSDDGTKAFFTASAPLQRCASGPYNYRCGDLYVRMTNGGVATTLQLNASERTPADPGGHQPAIYWDASRGGSRAFFTSTEQLTNDDNDSTADLYMYDVNAAPGRHLTRIGAHATAFLGASDDGHTAYFTADTQLVPGGPAITGDTGGIYVWTDRAGSPPGGSLRFIGMLGDFVDNVTEDTVSNTNVILRQRQSRVTPDGRFLLFTTTSGTGLLGLRPGGSDYNHGSCVYNTVPGCRELYLYDASGDSLVCVSCRPDRAPATADTSVSVEQLFGAARPAARLNRPLSADGTHVFFSTAEPLVAEDVNGRVDAYEWDAASGRPHLLSDGVSADDSYFLDASTSGQDAFIVTRSQLVGWDTDGAYDLYDVRLPLPGHPAGFPEPPTPPAQCSGEGCRGPIAAPPSPSPVDSAGFHGTGNLTKSVACGRGLTRKSVRGTLRCVAPRRRAQPRCRRGFQRRKVRGHVRCVRRRVARGSQRRSGGR